MNITQIEHNIKNSLENYHQDTFIYDLPLAYGLPKASISRLQKGSLNLSKNAAEILWKKKLFFKVVTTDELYSITDSYKSQPFSRGIKRYDLMGHDKENINEDQRKRIEMYVFEVLDEREKYSEKTLAELYDPDKMPDGLRQAHHNLDLAIEQCYRPKPFASDEERLEHLFTLYEQMTSKGIN